MLLIADLQKHISSVHEKNRPFLCSKCPKTFAYEKELKIHFQMGKTQTSALNNIKTTA